MLLCDESLFSGVETELRASGNMLDPDVHFNALRARNKMTRADQHIF